MQVHYVSMLQDLIKTCYDTTKNHHDFVTKFHDCDEKSLYHYLY